MNIPTCVDVYLDLVPKGRTNVLLLRLPPIACYASCLKLQRNVSLPHKRQGTKSGARGHKLRSWGFVSPKFLRCSRNAPCSLETSGTAT
eukprot:6119620-Amphidinium_carterae.1